MVDLRSSLFHARNTLQLLRRVRGAQLFVADGMRRSGSTLLFNIMRLTLRQQYGDGLSSGFITSSQLESNSQAYLIKAHGVSKIIASRSTAVLYTYRDFRDALMSDHVKFGKPITMDAVEDIVRIDHRSRKIATCIFKYEDCVGNLPAWIRDVANALAVNADVDRIERLLSQESAKEEDAKTNPETLYHGTHASGASPGSWRNEFTVSMREAIRERYGDWLTDRGYSLD